MPKNELSRATPWFSLAILKQYIYLCNFVKNGFWLGSSLLSAYIVVCVCKGWVLRLILISGIYVINSWVPALSNTNCNYHCKRFKNKIGNFKEMPYFLFTYVTSAYCIKNKFFVRVTTAWKMPVNQYLLNPCWEDVSRKMFGYLLPIKKLHFPLCHQSKPKLLTSLHP